MVRTGERKDRHEIASQGRLLASPAAEVTPGPTGIQPLGLGQKRDGIFYAPPGHPADRPAPLVLLLHGAGGAAKHGLGILRDLADATGVLLLAPESRDQTWDVINSGFGPDVAFIDQALAQTFAHYAVDPSHLAMAGFSDGASYALSLGLTNGDLFSHILAFSPGFMLPAERHDRPRIFVSHGTHDQVLPIDVCSRRIVPQLQRVGYDVTYQEFDGPHTIPPVIALAALDLFLSSSPETLRDPIGERNR